MGGQGLLILIGLKILIMMISLQNIVISDVQGLLMLMRSNSLIKMTRPQIIKIKRTMFCGLTSLSKILIPSISGGLEYLKWQYFAERSSWPKLSNLSKLGGLGCPFYLTSFSARPVLAFGCPFCTLGVFWLDFPCFFKEIIKVMGYLLINFVGAKV